MSQPAKRKKFKKGVEEYMKGKWCSEWEGIKPIEEARRRIKTVANARNRKDLNKFPGFNFEPIEGVKDYYSIRIGGQWRCFFIWEDNQAWEIEISKHDYKKTKR